MTDEQRDPGGTEQRVEGALQVARTRRGRLRRRFDQRRAHGLSVFERLGLERHHRGESD